MSKLKMIGYTSGAAVTASLTFLLIGLFVFGFQYTEWAEWEGRIVGVAGTIAGVAGAAFGLRMASRVEGRGVK
jgi:hypothetical protein